MRDAAGRRRIALRPVITGGDGRAWLRCRIEHLDGAALLDVEGEIDLASAPEFANTIASVFRHNDRVIIDLSRLSYIDGSGLRVLIDAARANPQRLVVVGSRPEVRRLFDILELDGAVPMVSTIAAAREYLNHQ